MLAQTAHGVGLPLALCTDRHGIFVTEPGRAPTLTEQLRGQLPVTQMGRALEALGVSWVPASSPRAKGRSERAWGTLQDRLVSELRRADAWVAEADVVLRRYLPRFDRRFGVPPAIEEPAWQAWPSPFPIEAELCFHYRRTVARDATIAWDGTALAVPRRRDRRSWSGRRVTVEEHLDGSLRVRDTIGSARRRRWHRYCGLGTSAGPVRSRHRVNGPSPTRRGHRVLPPRPDHHGALRPTIPGGATLPSGDGDKVAGRLAVRVAVLRHIVMV
jgi:hypothetical protein